MKALFLILSLVFVESTVTACIRDAESLFREKFRSHDLAKTILGRTSDSEDPQKLQARIKELEATRKENDADWWNNLAGAYLRLNQPEAAVKLLTPMVKRFPNDYGLHANLGTAYHLLGKYAEAETEIARDLEINPDAHFGLEKYHLALLQYLLQNSRAAQSIDFWVLAFSLQHLAFPSNEQRLRQQQSRTSRIGSEPFSSPVLRSKVRWTWIWSSYFCPLFRQWWRGLKPIAPLGNPLCVLTLWRLGVAFPAAFIQIACASSFRVKPSWKSDRSNKSDETVGSAFSIFARRDWLVLSRAATCTWVRRSF